MKIIRIITVIILLIVISCSPQYYLMDETKKLSRQKILITEPLFLNEILGVKEENDIFNLNLYVGSIIFSGPIITNQELGYISQSEKKLLGNQAAYRESASAFFLEILTDVIAQKMLNARIIKIREMGFEIKKNNLFEISFSPDRREHEEDGKDNLNLPRLIYTTGPLAPDAVLAFREKHQADIIMIPVIEHYYAHNGGWFNDQTWGCAAGGRITFHLYGFDAKTGDNVYIFRNTEREIIKFLYQLSYSDMSKRLYLLEKEMGEKIRKSFP